MGGKWPFKRLRCRCKATHNRLESMDKHRATFLDRKRVPRPKRQRVGAQPRRNTRERQSVLVEIRCRGRCRFAMVCGSLGVIFLRPSSGVDERIKAFLGSAATVHQQQQSKVVEGCSAADRIWLGSGRFRFGRARRRAAFRTAPSKRPDFVFAPGSFDEPKPDIQYSAGKIGYGQAPRRIVRGVHTDRG
jgi:hypothetical protein